MFNEKTTSECRLSCFKMTNQLSSSTQNCVSLPDQSHQNTSFDNQGAHAGSTNNVLSPEIQKEAANYLMQLKIQPSRLIRLSSNDLLSVPENLKIKSSNTDLLMANQLRAPRQGEKDLPCHNTYVVKIYSNVIYIDFDI